MMHVTTAAITAAMMRTINMISHASVESPPEDESVELEPLLLLRVVEDVKKLLLELLELLPEAIVRVCCCVEEVFTSSEEDVVVREGGTKVKIR